MALSFLELAQGGALDLARGVLRNLFPQGNIPTGGAGFNKAISRVLQVGRTRGQVDHETARLVVRRARSSLMGARNLETGGRRIPDVQHGYDPSFQGLTAARYVYRTIVFCTDEATGLRTRTPVDVESNDRIDRQTIEEQALTAYIRGQSVLTARSNTYAIEGSCADVDVVIVFAIRTGE